MQWEDQLIQSERSKFKPQQEGPVDLYWEEPVEPQWEEQVDPNWEYPVDPQ